MSEICKVNDTFVGEVVVKAGVVQDAFISRGVSLFVHPSYIQYIQSSTTPPLILTSIVKHY